MIPSLIAGSGWSRFTSDVSAPRKIPIDCSSHGADSSAGAPVSHTPAHSTQFTSCSCVIWLNRPLRPPSSYALRPAGEKALQVMLCRRPVRKRAEEREWCFFTTGERMRCSDGTGGRSYARLVVREGQPSRVGFERTIRRQEHGVGV